MGHSNYFLQVNIWNTIYLNWEERYEDMIDLRSYTHILSSCEIKVWKIRGWTGFEPMIFAIAVQYPLCEQFQLNTIGSDEIESIISTMPSNKAPGIDKISVRVLKDCLAPILPAITSVINTSIESCIFTTTRKLAEVIPLPKTWNHELVNNNRPISRLPVLSKVSQKVVHNQSTSYLQLNDRLTKTQW